MSDEYRRIRLLWPDHLGLARGKYLPARAKPTSTGHCISLFALGFDRNMTPHDGAFYYQGTPDLEARFRPEDVRPGWEKDTGVVIPDVFKDGEAVEMAPRHVLRKALADWNALGYTVKVGLELEAYLMERGPDGAWRPIDTPGGYVYGTGTAVDPAGVIDEVMAVCREAGIGLESVHSEYDNSQFELTLEHAEPLSSCDDAFLFKVLAREVTARRGYHLTFMGKPISDRGGNGTHVNLSIWKDGQNAFVDPDAADGLSSLARNTIGGLIEHHRGIAAVCAPTVNAYKRLRPGQMVGVWANWGYDHRGVAIRIPPARGPSTRLEHRLSDGGVGPHIATAAVLQAARLGVVNAIEPPPAETGDCWKNVDTDLRAAANLSLALDDLESDVSIVEALGRAFVDAFLVVKRAEWERYARHTTDWELDEYLHFL
ncbi:MAG TPA: glutamine synthetase family protein [Vicinamibacteria bacterium]|nr:glutamine synthetase family protein [Vicinamibacteria bacterium]